MSPQVAHLHRIRKQEVSKVGGMLAGALGDDPLWLKLMEGFPQAKFDRTLSAFCQATILHCVSYGEVYATSEDLEGIIAWVPGISADMTIRQQLRSGAFFKGLQAMVLLGSRSRTAVRAVAPVPPARHTSMKGRPFLYLQVLGVAPQFQGSGFDAKLLDALVERSEQTGVALYTETTLERAANLYERHGFKAINRTALPVLDLPLWGFVREPSAR